MYIILRKEEERDPRRVWWSEKDRERMTRPEFEALRVLFAAMCNVSAVERDLQKRLKSIPGGKQRMAMARGQLKALVNDLKGTITKAQRDQIDHTAMDMVVQFVQKLSPGSKNVILQVPQVQALVECAQEKCRLCVATGEDARGCRLYRVLEAISPLDDYGTGTTCPYYLKRFKEE